MAFIQHMQDDLYTIVVYRRHPAYWYLSLWDKWLKIVFFILLEVNSWFLNTFLFIKKSWNMLFFLVHGVALLCGSLACTAVFFVQKHFLSKMVNTILFTNWIFIYGLHFVKVGNNYRLRCLISLFNIECISEVSINTPLCKPNNIRRQNQWTPTELLSETYVYNGILNFIVFFVNLLTKTILKVIHQPA